MGGYPLHAKAYRVTEVAMVAVGEGTARLDVDIEVAIGDPFQQPALLRYGSERPS